MMRSLLVAVSLEGQLPGSARLRDPLPVVWYDRVREVCRLAALHALARRLTHPGRERSKVDSVVGCVTSVTGLAPGGWASCVFCRLGAETASAAPPGG
ncbi:MAG TPA: hypothetical protein VGA37_09105 [Gemmatimonadales bacterium]